MKQKQLQDQIEKLTFQVNETKAVNVVQSEKNVKHEKENT